MAERFPPDHPVGGLLNLKHLAGAQVRRRVADLSGEDRGVLTSVVAGRARGVSTGDRRKAVALLAMLDDDEAVAVLGGLLAADREDEDLRASAATALGGMRRADVEAVLVRNLGADPPEVRGRVLRALARVGGAMAWAALDESRADLAERFGQDYELARALVGFRLERRDVRLALPQPAHRVPEEFDSTLDLAVEPLPAREIGEAVEGLDGPTYRLALSRDVALVVRLGDASWLVLLDEVALASGLAGDGADHGRLVALVARSLAETGSHTVQYLVATQPLDGDTSELGVLRPDGTAVYAGWLSTERRGVRFSISDVERPGAAPTLVFGTALRPDGSVTGYVAPRRSDKIEVPPLPLGR